MVKKPLILKLLALYLILDPVLRAAVISIETEFSFFHVIAKTFSLDAMNVFNFWALFPLSGVLILTVNPLSYGFYIATQIYALFMHWNYTPYDWPYLAPTPFVTAYVLLFVNIFFVIYLLMPGSRVFFFDKNLRWWERGSRFLVNEPCFVTYMDKEIHGKVKDLAKNGALLASDEPLSLGDIVQVEFDILDRKLSMGAQVVREAHTDGVRDYGVQFLFNGTWDKAKLRFLMLMVLLSGDYEKLR